MTLTARPIAAFAAVLFLLAQSARSENGPGGHRKLQLNVGVADTAQLENLKSVRAGSFAAHKTYVLQLDGPLTAQRGEALRQAGIALGEYLPEHAYVVNLNGLSPEAVGGVDFVAWVGEFRNEWKLDPELGRRVPQTPERQAMAQRGEIPLTITLFENRGAGKVIEFLQTLPGAVIHYVEAEGPVMVVSATVRAGDAPALAQLNDVHYVEEAPEITLRNSTTRWIIQSNVTNSTPVWDRGITGVGQILGHMDGRINISHCAFFDPVNNTPGPGHRKIVAYNTSLGYDQHGTHTAGTAAGEDYNGSTGNLRGMAYNAKISHSLIPSFSDTGFYNAAATQYGQGARVSTNSWGNDGTTSYDGLCRGIDRFSYDNEDALICFAVTNTSTLKNPENAKNLLAVAATQDTPNQGNACFGTSGTGPTADGRRKPEIYAPGCGTNSASGSGSSCSTAALTGTSMASPAIAGIGLLVREYYMDGFYPSGVATPGNAFTPSGALVKATLLNSTVDMTGVTGYPSNKEGWGRALLDNALYFSGDARKLVVPADIRNANGMSTGQQQQYNITVLGSSEPLKVTLVWTDPPASASTGTGAAEINNLDLEVVAPNSDLYRGNVFSSGVSATGGSADPENNVEMVLLDAPAAGGWTLRVRATAVNSGLQGFALVASGNISAQGPAPEVDSINPNSGAAGSVLPQVSISGSNFQVSGTTTIKLVTKGEPDIVATSVGVLTSSTIAFSLDLTTANPGLRDVVVTNPDGQTGTLANGFEVATCVLGDLNDDGLRNGADIARFTQILVNGNGTATARERCAGDVEPTRDGIIGLDDIPTFVNCFLGCGCGLDQTDSDSDSVVDCLDGCPNDPAKTAPGACGCGASETDSDGDGSPDCNDMCPGDPAKVGPGQCGCGNLETDTDNDGIADCVDPCPTNPAC